MNRKNPFATLQRFARPQASDATEVEICEFCSQDLLPRHRHLLEVANRKIICACDACALRFQDVIEGRFRLIPRDATVLPDFRMEDAQWEELALPINLVFIFMRGTDGKMAAAYPSPAGVTESLLTIENWQTLAIQNSQLAGLKPDVEALLINRVGETRAYFIAPIDWCFELAGLVRTHWRGFSGGEHIWTEIERFFVKLRDESSSAPSKHQTIHQLYA
jgi:hypothetical protein